MFIAELVDSNSPLLRLEFISVLMKNISICYD